MLAKQRRARARRIAWSLRNLTKLLRRRSLPGRAKTGPEQLQQSTSQYVEVRAVGRNSPVDRAASSADATQDRRSQILRLSRISDVPTGKLVSLETRREDPFSTN